MSWIYTFSLGQHVGALFVVCLFIGVEFYLKRLKKQKSKEFDVKKAQIESIEEIEDMSLEHYRELQQVDVVRFVVILVGVFFILSMYNVQIFSIIAVVAGALILALRESFVSFITYFYILSTFKLGDDIRISGMLGEIVRVKPLYTALAGKDDNGEYNSKLYHVPNFMFLSQTLEQQQLKSDDYYKMSLQILYSQSMFSETFALWLEKIEACLDGLLPKRAITKVGYFKGYAGICYKLNFDYNEKGDVIVKISFIAKREKAVEYKEGIIRFVESIKKVPLEVK
jgi:hypothetical protein